MNSGIPAPEIFKAYDIRGVVDETLTAEVVRQIGHALGSEAKQYKQDAIIVGRDGRLSGPELCRSLTEGIMASGCDVIDIGLAPTPLVYFAAQRLKTRSAVAVTGSHNPPNYNGLKMVIAGETLSGDRIQGIYQRIVNSDLTDGTATRMEKSVTDDYVQRIVDDIQVDKPLKLVVDCGNGVAGAIAPRLYRELGCEVIELYCDVDGNFPNHHPDPSQVENLKDLIAAVQSHDADLGFAFDGDGDRLGVVTRDGDVIWPDRQMILFSRDILTRQPGAKIIFDVKCSRNLPLAIRAAGGEPIMWRTGHSFIKSKLKETEAALAGEMSGHIFFKERWYGFDDGIYTGARLLELVAKDGRPATQIFNELPDSINTPELRIEMTEGDHFTFMDELVQSADFPDAEVTTIDGVRADFADGFGLIRASNTTPILVLRFEADSQEAMSRIQDQFRAWINATRPDVDLPF